MIAIAAGWFAVGCASNAETVPDDGPRDRATATAALTATSVETAPPMASSSNASSGPPSASGVPGVAEEVCLMRYVCACNVGCAKVRVPKSELKAGTKVRMLTGPEAGKDAFLEEVPRKTGGKALVLGNTDPTVGPLPCMNARAASLLAFPCSADKSGPADVESCLRGCE